MGNIDEQIAMRGYADLLKQFRSIIKEEISALKLEKTQGTRDTEVLLTRKEAAGHLRVSTSCLDNYTREGRIPYYRIGGNIRFKKDDLDKSLSGARANHDAF